jgi:hypothetical protein
MNTIADKGVAQFQILSGGSETWIYVLLDDGTLWFKGMTNRDGSWTQLT